VAECICNYKRTRQKVRRYCKKKRITFGEVPRTLGIWLEFNSARRRLAAFSTRLGRDFSTNAEEVYEISTPSSVEGIQVIRSTVNIPEGLVVVDERPNGLLILPDLSPLGIPEGVKAIVYDYLANDYRYKGSLPTVTTVIADRKRREVTSNEVSLLNLYGGLRFRELSNRNFFHRHTQPGSMYPGWPADGQSVNRLTRFPAVKVQPGSGHWCDPFSILRRCSPDLVFGIDYFVAATYACSSTGRFVAKDSKALEPLGGSWLLEYFRVATKGQFGTLEIDPNVEGRNFFYIRSYKDGTLNYNCSETEDTRIIGCLMTFAFAGSIDKIVKNFLDKISTKRSWKHASDLKWLNFGPPT
jgi:hypothetical protein